MSCFEEIEYNNQCRQLSSGPASGLMLIDECYYYCRDIFQCAMEIRCNVR